MKNRRIIASLVAALSSFASSLAVGSGNGGNVKIISKVGRANINSKFGDNKLDAPSRNKSRKSSGNKSFLGKKRNRSEGSTSPSGDRHGSKDKNSANGKQDKKPSKNSGAIGASKSLTGNKPVSLKSNLGKSPKSNTIIPHVPNGVTYSGGAVAGTALAAVVTELIASKGFHRSIIDKIRNGITVQGMIDYVKKNLTFTTQEVKINDQKKNVGLLVLDLKNGRKMYINVYEYNYFNNLMRNSFIGYLSGGGDNSQELKDLSTKISKPKNIFNYDGDAKVDNLAEWAYEFVYYLTSELRTNSKCNELENSVFYGINRFYEKDWDYFSKEIKDHIADLIKKKIENNVEFKFLHFKRTP